MGRVVPVGEAGFGVGSIAVGDGGVWVSGWDRHGGRASRLDPATGDVVASVRVPHDGRAVAVGAGAVWSAGEACIGPHPDDPDVCVTEPRLSRIDPDTDKVAATVAIPLPPGTRPDTASTSAVAVGAGAVWLAVGWGPATGELVRIDPTTNAIVARIPTGGDVGDLRLGAGSLWLLSHPEQIGETKVGGASLLRIDPATNTVVATPIRGGLPFLGGGGTEYPPVLAVGRDAAWVAAPTAAHPRLALRVDAQTGRVSREQLPVDHFNPVAVEQDAIWFIGSDGSNATLARLDARTLQQTDTTKLPLAAVQAALDPAAENLWLVSPPTLATERARVVRVQLH